MAALAYLLTFAVAFAAGSVWGVWRLRRRASRHALATLAAIERARARGPSGRGVGSEP